MYDQPAGQPVRVLSPVSSATCASLRVVEDDKDEVVAHETSGFLATTTLKPKTP
jgi:hypothetical protein